MSANDASTSIGRAQGQGQGLTSAMPENIKEHNATELSTATTTGPSNTRAPNGTSPADAGRAHHAASNSSASRSSRPSTGSGTTGAQAGSSARPSTSTLRDTGRAQSPPTAQSSEQRRANVCLIFYHFVYNVPKFIANLLQTRGNRLSGFFSGLRPRPQTMPPTPLVPPTPRPPPQAQVQAPKPKQKVSDPLPPSLDAPTLRDLGLSLNVLTPSLFPSHYATPPTSGTFMQPHFLLLCHSQGLDVLPLVGPPAPQAYALIRRVAFKSVVVMEERGVLVAIAGRRDGVRVYALEEVRRAIEWRMDVEVQREAEKTRKEESRSRPSLNGTAELKARNMQPRPPTLLPPRPIPTVVPNRTPPPNYSSLQVPTVTLNRQSSSNAAPSNGIPPASSPTLAEPSRPSRERGMSVSSMVQTRMLVGNNHGNSFNGTQEEKNEWLEGEGSEDEALVAAGPSASAALEERTSSMPVASSTPLVPSATGDIPEVAEDGSDGDMDPMAQRESIETPSPSEPALANPSLPESISPPPSSRRPRPASLHLRPPTTAPPQNATELEDDMAITPPVSPAPTVFSLQRSLSQGPSNIPATPPPRQNERITFAQALMESRLPTANPPMDLARLRAASSTVYDPNVNDDDDDEDVADTNTSTPRDPTTPTAATTPLSSIPPNNSTSATSGRRASSATLNSNTDQRSRRRWSFLGGPTPNIDPTQRTPQRTGATPHPSQDFTNGPPSASANAGPRTAPLQNSNGTANGYATVNRSPSMPGTPTRSRPSRPGSRLQRMASNPGPISSSNTNPYSRSPSTTSIPTTNTNANPNPRTPKTPRRFLPKLLGAFRSSNHDRQNNHHGRNGGNGDNSSDSDTDRPSVTSVQGVSFGAGQNGGQAPPPKMEYVKLPGTHKALMIKSVETAKKRSARILHISDCSGYCSLFVT